MPASSEPIVRKRSLAFTVVAACMLVLGSSGAAPPGSFARVIRQAAPSVVTVLVRDKPEDAAQRAAERATTARDKLLTGLPTNLPSQGPEMGLGSGFIISADGLIVTNRHVLAGPIVSGSDLQEGRNFQHES